MVKWEVNERFLKKLSEHFVRNKRIFWKEVPGRGGGRKVFGGREKKGEGCKRRFVEKSTKAELL